MLYCLYTILASDESDEEKENEEDGVETEVKVWYIYIYIYIIYHNQSKFYFQLMNNTDH